MNNAEVLIKFKGDNSQDGIKEQEQKLESLKTKATITATAIATAVDKMAVSFLKMGVNYNAEIETYLTRLTTLTGSAEEANNILNQIKQDALKTPFDVSSLTQAESLLLSTGISATQVRNDIINLGNAISASGGGNEELQRMAVNLQQIKNVGKASALDIKQFAYAGIDIYGLLADSMGITREEASDLDVTYEMLSKALGKASAEGGKYYQAMEKQSQTMKGASSNLKESWQVLAGELSEGLFNAIKDIIPMLTNLFDWLAQNKDIVIAIALPLLTMINIIAGFLIIQKIAGLFSALWGVLMANPIILIISLIVGLVAGFIYLWNNCEAFRNFFINAWEMIKNAVWLAIVFITECWNNLMELAQYVGKKIFEITIQPFIDIYNFIVSIFTKIGKAVHDIVDKIKSVFGELPENLKNIGKNMIEGLVNGIKGMKDKAVEGVKLGDKPNVLLIALSTSSCIFSRLSV